MTRSVRDAAIVLEAIAGHDANDPTSLDVPVPRMLDEIGRGVQGFRIGFDRAYALDSSDPGLASAIEVALGELERLGAQVVDVQVPDVTAVLAAWPVVCAAEAVAAHRDTYPSRADEYGAYFREFLDFGASVSEAELATARQVGKEFSARFRAVLASVDAVLSPAGGSPFTVPSGLQYGSLTEWNQAMADQSVAIDKAYTAFTFLHNFAGTPTLTLPCGLSNEGPPYTMQLAGNPLSEAMLCRIGHAYEQVTQWHERHPRV
jgi:amidase